MSDISEILGVRPVLPVRHLPTRAGSQRTPSGGAPYRSTKTYTQSEGLSCCFRQWRAKHSHCSLLHGYSLSFHFVFAAHELDEMNWVFDFGGLKPVKAWLHHMFDHTTLVSDDDPQLEGFQDLAARGVVNLRILPAVGCEAVARQVHEYVNRYVQEQSKGRVWVESVEVGEHTGNSAIYSEVMP